MKTVFILFMLMFVGCAMEHNVKHEIEIKGKVTMDHNINITICDDFKKEIKEECVFKVLDLLDFIEENKPENQEGP